MNKLRPLRFKNMWVDMTAMCDLALLLLVFFIGTANFDQWEPMKVETPKTSHNIYIPNVCMGIIYIADNKVMYQIIGDNLSVATLDQISRIYKMPFSAAERDKFINSPIIGASVCDLKGYDNTYMDWTHNNVYHPGIPYNEGALDANELFNWIKQSRLCARAFYMRDMRLIIKADKNAKYPVVKRVIEILKAQKVNKFALMTEDKEKEV